MVVSSDAARKLLAAPKRTIRTAKQTLENCQENLQSLGNLLQQTMAANLAVTPRAISYEAELVSRSAHPLVTVVVRQSIIGISAGITEVEDRRPDGFLTAALTEVMAIAKSTEA